MEPVFPMPDHIEAQAEPGPLARQLAMLKELHQATVEAFRVELRRAVHERLQAQMEAEQAWAALEKRTNQMREDHTHRLSRMHKQFCSVWTMLNELVTAFDSPGLDPNGEGLPPAFWIAIKEARELLTASAEYLE